MDRFVTQAQAPRTLLFGAVLLLASAMMLAGVARQTGVGASRAKAPDAVRTIDLRFADRQDGAVIVRAVSAAEPSLVIPPGRDGFVRVALRSLAFERRAAGLGQDVPFRLGLQADGGLWLEDLATGRVLNLDAYGAENARSFGQIFKSGRAVQ